jgi:hypothetical protein
MLVAVASPWDKAARALARQREPHGTGLLTVNDLCRAMLPSDLNIQKQATTAQHLWCSTCVKSQRSLHLPSLLRHDHAQGSVLRLPPSQADRRCTTRRERNAVPAPDSVGREP